MARTHCATNNCAPTRAHTGIRAWIHADIQARTHIGAISGETLQCSAWSYLHKSGRTAMRSVSHFDCKKQPHIGGHLQMQPKEIRWHAYMCLRARNDVCYCDDNAQPLSHNLRQ